MRIKKRDIFLSELLNKNYKKVNLIPLDSKIGSGFIAYVLDIMQHHAV